jgi:two-component system sensor histidine kinase/response regulator
MDSAVIESQLNAFAEKLAGQISAILQTLAGEYSKEPVQVATAERFSHEQKRAITMQLAAMLANDDAKAERLIGDNTALLMACMPDQFRELRQAVREYDFEQALALLGAAANMPTTPEV